jgi:hypothetical protein
MYGPFSKLLSAESNRLGELAIDLAYLMTRGFGTCDLQEAVKEAVAGSDLQQRVTFLASTA